MKLNKIFIVFLGLFLLVGCTATDNTPSSKVEEFMEKYQRLDDEVLTQLDLTLDSDTEMNADQKKDYRSLMEKQYQNLSYKITDEKVEDDTATVDVEIEVFDYQTSITKSKEYYESHPEEFKTTEGTDNNATSSDDDNDTDLKNYIEYKIKEMKNVTDKATYTMTFNLTKNEDDEWVLDDITDTDRQKLHGLY
ncbi:MAG: hypothetical protein J6A17_01880 [Bacilli bacterium]|nr:hypothetical protein [Bacilli bacterium]